MGNQNAKKRRDGKKPAPSTNEISLERPMKRSASAQPDCDLHACKIWLYSF